MQNTGTVAVPAERGRSALDIAYRAAVALWVGIAAVQFVVYLAIAAGTGTLDAPWFLWEVAGGALIVGGLRYARTHPVSTWLK